MDGGTAALTWRRVALEKKKKTRIVTHSGVFGGERIALEGDHITDTLVGRLGTTCLCVVAVCQPATEEMRSACGREATTSLPKSGAKFRNADLVLRRHPSDHPDGLLLSSLLV